MPEASQGRRVWDLSDEMIKERRWSFELALRRELDETGRGLDETDCTYNPP